MAPQRPLIFSPGLPRAGSSSLEAALSILGWTPLHKTLKLSPDPARCPTATALMRRAESEGRPPMHYLEALGIDAVLDCSYVWQRFEQLDVLHPEALWIFCWRSRAEWVESRLRLLARRPGAWGANPRPELWPDLHDRWVSRVSDHFRHHPRYLELRICDGEGWAPLCAFLDRPEPDVPFPWRNSSPAHPGPLDP